MHDKLFSQDLTLVTFITISQNKKALPIAIVLLGIQYYYTQLVRLQDP